MNELPTRCSRLWIGRCLSGALCALLTACTHLPPEPAEPVAALLHDEFHAQPLEPVDSDAVFALSPAMRLYAERELSARSPGDALQEPGGQAT